jgi:hypothetical protein
MASQCFINAIRLTIKIGIVRDHALSLTAASTSSSSLDTWKPAAWICDTAKRIASSSEAASLSK